MTRLDVLGIVLLSMSLVVGFFGFSRINSNTEDVTEWLPDDSEAREDLEFFESRFGSDDFLVMTWKNCTVSDPRLELLSSAIKNLDREQLVQNIVHGQSIMRLMTEQYRIPKQQVARRLRGVFYGCTDPTLTCLNVELSSIGALNRWKSMDLVHQAIGQTPGLKIGDVSFGGYPYIATTIDKQLMNSLRYWLVPSVALATLISLLCLRDFVLTAIVFSTSMAAAFISLALIPLTGVEFSGLMSIIPALVFVLTTSGCVHLIHYSMRVGVQARDVVRAGWLPCTVSATTTIAGMMSLYASQFPAIRKFGLFCASGVAVGLVFQLIVVPWLLQRFGKKAVAKMSARRTSHARFWNRWYREVYRYRFGVVGLSLLVFVGGLIGLTRLTARVEVENLFKKNSPVLISLQKLEEQLGPLDQTELLIVFKQIDVENFDRRVQQVRQIQAAVARIPAVKFTHSLINYLPAEPKARDLPSFFVRSTYRSRLRRERQNLSNGRNLVIDGDQEIWRISLRFPFTSEYDWAALGNKVKQVASGALKSSLSSDTDLRDSANAELVYTGRANLFQNAQQSLLVDLFRNFLLAFVMITPMLVIALRSVSIGLLAMLPNIFPAVALFGAMGLVGYPVDLAIAMTACIALGIAVDDTTHFLVSFRKEKGSLGNAALPIQRIMQRCGAAMLHTTLIACGGLLVYAFGEMQVVARFAVSISLLMALALIADLVMMPSILLVLEPPFKSKSKSRPAETADLGK